MLDQYNKLIELLQDSMKIATASLVTSLGLLVLSKQLGLLNLSDSWVTTCVAIAIFSGVILVIPVCVYLKELGWLLFRTHVSSKQLTDTEKLIMECISRKGIDRVYHISNLEYEGELIDADYPLLELSVHSLEKKGIIKISWDHSWIQLTPLGLQRLMGIKNKQDI